jgi:putative membrane protein
MSIAGDISLYAVRASEIAIERSADERTRVLAQGVLVDQRGVASQLSMAGRRVNLLPDASLTPLLEEELEALRRSGDVDRDYRRLVANALSGVLEAHETFARAGTSATLRPVAQMAAPVTRRNLDAVRR